MNASDDILTLQGRLHEVLAELGDAEPVTSLQAQAVLEKIRISKGFLDDDLKLDLNNLKPQNRAVMLGFVERSRQTEAAYTSSISEQLYSSKYRFLYEIVQNADDSLYRIADAERNARSLRITLMPGSIIVDTNEDGFKRSNVEAICETGRSSKKASVSDDHIGEKGFGFKAVFAIANEVHVQSGLWSFKFQHNPGDDGLGMVTPLDTPPEALPFGVRTRISLRLLDTSPEGFEKIVEAFEDMPTTTIFFLQRLEGLELIVNYENGRNGSVAMRKRDLDKSSNSMIISREMSHNGQWGYDESTYLCFNHRKASMPIDRHREGKTCVTIDLAFPIDSISKQPKLSGRGEYIFAYLPLQPVPQLPFLIQSDFITTGSRETIMDCPWNDAIAVGVAEAFCCFVTEHFATANHSLKYSWLDYLPTSPINRPWNSLYKRIINSLKKRSILQSWESKTFKPTNQLRQLPAYTLHNGEPLFKDLRDEAYLAPEYCSRHKRIFDDLGAVTMRNSDIIDRLQADLVSPESRLKTIPFTESWHNSFAKLVRKLLKEGDDNIRRRIKKLAIIPLTGRNQWTGSPGPSPALASIYFPTTGKIYIPLDLPLYMISYAAIFNSERRRFYEEMGVEDCPEKTVLSKIEEKHRRGSSPFRIREHLKYLFHFHPDPEDIFKWIRIPSSTEEAVRASRYLFYFPSNNEYDLYQLLPDAAKQDPQSLIKFLPQDLVDSESRMLRVQDITWTKWLARISKARYHPPLTLQQSSGEYTLTEELKEVLKYNPKKFLGALRAHWDEYRHEVDKVSADLMKCQVPCLSENLEKLEATYLPTPEILSKLPRLGISRTDTAIPLLALPGGALTDSTCRQWEFLERFEVGLEPDLNFYMILLGAYEGNGANHKSALEDVYASMGELVQGNQESDLRLFFNEFTAIWDSQHGYWVTLSHCVWEGPSFFLRKAVLEKSYGHNVVLRRFFTKALDVPNWTLQDILEEIKERRDQSQSATSQSLAREIYEFLDTKVDNDRDRKVMKNAFSEEKLILDESGTWHTLNACVWESAFALGGFKDISVVYPGLQRFFVQTLGLKKASPSMLINEVKRMAGKKHPNISDIRHRLIDVSLILRRVEITPSILEALKALKEVAFLPKKLADGESVLVKLTDDRFAISDHVRYGQAFSEHDILLDFDVSEVHKLHLLFEYFGVTNRYLSVLVREVSEVGNDAVEHDRLSKELQEKAYALFCCAAKFKSAKALQGDRRLFDQLSTAFVFTTDEISSYIVLPIGKSSHKVRSDRAIIHHEIIDDRIRIWVPLDQRQRRKCYWSQLPRLLTSLLEIDISAELDIHVILENNVEELDAILFERDITCVDWVEKPVIAANDVGGIELLEAPHRSSQVYPVVNGSESPVDVADIRGLLAPTPSQDPPPYTLMPPQYTQLIDQVVRSAQRASYRLNDAIVPVANLPSLDRNPPSFDRVATFGIRESNQFNSHDRRIGAAGEAYVYKCLSALSLPNFTRENWRSTIRGELSSSTHFSDLQNWSGRETADLVYTDTSGLLTAYLRENCVGGFPEAIQNQHDFAADPIEYLLEVKTTTDTCSTQFYLSRGQYKRMKNLSTTQNTPRTPISSPRQIYVIIRVYDLISQNVGMKIFVDPLRLRDRWIKFEVQQWIGTTL